MGLVTVEVGHVLPEDAPQVGLTQDQPEYDTLWTQAKTELDEQKRAQLFIQMNDIAMGDIAHIPLVNRKSVAGRAKNLRNTAYTIWDQDYWNIANWQRG